MNSTGVEKFRKLPEMKLLQARVRSNWQEQEDIHGEAEKPFLEISVDTRPFIF